LEILRCCWEGKSERLNEFLSAGLDPNFKAVSEIPLIHSTILGDELKESQKISIIRLLMDAGAKLNVTDAAGASALMIACAGKHNEIVSFLLEKGADIHQVNKIGDTALFYASSTGNTEAARKLLAASANANAKNNLNRTSLMWAAREGHLEIVKMLLEAGAVIECEDSDGIRLIQQSAFRGHKEITEYLLVRSPNEEKFISLEEAASAGLYDLVKNRLEAGADLNKRNSNGFSALDLSIMYKHKNIFEMLISRVQSASDLGHALGVAVLSDSLEISQRLIAAGADLNFKDETGSTPLMLAASKNLPSITKLLLQSGADAEVENLANDTAVDIAQKKGSYDALQELYRREKTSEPNAK